MSNFVESCSCLFYMSVTPTITALHERCNDFNGFQTQSTWDVPGQSNAVESFAWARGVGQSPRTQADLVSTIYKYEKLESNQ